MRGRDRAWNESEERVEMVLEPALADREVKYVRATKTLLNEI